MKLVLVDMFGQFKIGDTILIVQSDKFFKASVKDVLNYGTDKEEVIINKTKNLYFIVAMYLKNKSWAKQVFKIESE